MSKSDSNKNNVIFLLESKDSIIKKIRRAVTDSNNPPIINYDPVKKPGISNLLNILSSITDVSIKKLEQNFKGRGYNYLKDMVIETILSMTTNLKIRYRILRKDENYLRKVLYEGAKNARSLANVTLKKVYEIIGFYN